MRCDDSGGVCAADQPHRGARSEQMREKEGDTRQKGEEWRASEQQSNALSLLKQDQITASPVETVGMVQSNIQHCA